MKKLIYAFIISFTLTFTVTNVFANYDNWQATGCNENNPKNCPSPTQICENGEHYGNPHCEEPTNTPIPPSITSLPTPTIALCFEDDSEIPLPCPTMTSTPTITVSPTAGASATPTTIPGPTEGSGGYFDDHLGCGTHSCVGPPPTPNPIPTNAPATGRAIN